jgi:hypothetical protein
MPVLETVTAFKSLKSRTNDFRVEIRSSSGKVSSISFTSVSANLAEWLSTIGISIGTELVLVIELS